MNWLLLVVILIMAWSIFRGYTKGFLRIIYSLVAWIVVVFLAAAATPYVSQMISDKTSIGEKVYDTTYNKISTTIQEKDQPQEDSLENLGIKVPKNVADKLFKETGVYDTIAGNVSNLAVNGVSFVLLLLIFALALKILFQIIKVVEKIPVIGGMNKSLGVLLGAVKGIILIWLLFAIVALNSTSETGIKVISYIYESNITTFLYENNGVLSLILLFI